MEFEYLWDLRPVFECRDLALDRLKRHRPSLNESEDSPVVTRSSVPSMINQCSRCPAFSYYSPEEFREHSKSEWHIHNLKNPSESLTFDSWSQKLSYSDDGDSCSSSSNESSSCDEGPKPSKMLLNSIPYHLVGESGLAIPSVITDITPLLNAKHFAVLILRSGRFAGAIWDATTGNVLVHTCMKRYTVRRKNGGSQRKNDNAKGSPANSIGAQIRRFQEQKLSEEIEELITKKWNTYLDSPTTVVFAYASKSHTQSLFIGPLDKTKSKCTIFPVPLSVRDPTYAEVCRIYSSMTKIAISR
jgi:hypothetical protein